MRRIDGIKQHIATASAVADARVRASLPAARVALSRVSRLLPVVPLPSHVPQSIQSLRRQLRSREAMLLQQVIANRRHEQLHYAIENLTTQPVYWSVYRKKVVVFGAAPIEQLTEPALVQAGETTRTVKPDIKVPWKRYILFSLSPNLLTSSLVESEFNALLGIWVDELNTVMLTESRAEDGVRVLAASSWASWAARKKLAPASAAISAKSNAITAEITRSIAGERRAHAYDNQVARVRTGPSISSEEAQFNSMRARVVRGGLTKLTGIDCSGLDAADVPRISICGSGGGYRAMVATMGSLIGLEDAGILDCVTSMSGLSGSTWAMASWYSGGATLRATRDALALKLAEDFYTTRLWPETIKAHVRERIGFDQELGLVDVMAWHLHYHLMRDLPTKEELWNHPRLSEQAATIADGSKPMPIYTAVAHEHKRFRWLEFTPFEVGVSQEIEEYIPTWSFGRRFDGGTSCDFALEPPLALLKATWGSAFCATVDQMFHEIATTDEKEPVLQRLLYTLVYEKLELSEDRLITPAKFANFSLNSPSLAESEHPWHAMKNLKVMDAGVHANLPFPPLCRGARGTDLIIALDQSSAPDILSSVSLDIHERWCREEGLPFPDCSEALSPPLPASSGPPSASAITTDNSKHSAASRRHCTVIRGDLSKGVPWIVYLPLLRNDSFSLLFDPRSADFCSTFNFRYTKDQVHQLSGLTETNIRTVRDELVDCIRQVTEERMVLNKAKHS